jgi:hypothetical protein
MTQPPKFVSGEKLSFGIRTVISAMIQVVIIAFFLSKLDAKISRLDEIVNDVKAEAKTQAGDAALWRAKMEAEIATINVRLAIIENQLHLQQTTKP